VTKRRAHLDSGQTPTARRSSDRPNRRRDPEWLRDSSASALDARCPGQLRFTAGLARSMTFGSWRSPGGSRRTGDTVRRQPRRWSRNGVAGAPLRRGVGRYTSAFQRVRAARGTLEGTRSPWRTGRPGTSNGSEDVTDSSTEQGLEVDRPWRSPEAAATSTSERVRARQSGTSGSERSP
jgi:hypothetical protein